MFDDNLRPIPKKDVDYTALPLSPTPEEYFLLSRINGNVTVAEICAISGLSRDATMTALGRLQTAGLIEFPAAAPPQQPAPRVARQVPQPQTRPQPAQPARPKPTPKPAPVDMSFGAESAVTGGAKPATPQAAPQANSAPPSTSASAASADDRFAGWPVSMAQFDLDAELMGQSVEIDEDFKKELIYVAGMLGRVDYYQLLGVSRDAKRKQIRNAYFALSKRYHPDSFYGKEMGGFSALVDEIFNGLNKADQMLSHKKKRVEYDKTLAPEVSAASASPSYSPPAASSTPSVQPSAGGAESARKREMAFGVLVKRAEKLEASGDYVGAAEEYNKAFAIKKDAAVALRGANLLMRSGEEHLDEAIAMARAAATAEPDNAKVYLLIGDASEEKGDYDTAREYYEKARGLDPSNKIVARRLKYLDSVTR